MSGDNDWEEEDKSDLTRLEDLSDFLHEDDPSLEGKLDQGVLDGQPSETEDDEENSFEDDELDDSFAAEDSFAQEETQPDIDISGLHEENHEEDENLEETQDFQQDFDSSEDSDDFALSDDDSFTEEEEQPNDFSEAEEDDQFLSDDSTEEESEDEPFAEEESFTESQDFSEDEQEDGQEEEPAPPLPIETPIVEEVISSPPPRTEHPPRENFQEVRDFGNAMSYGQVASGGNPPFSIILRNIKFSEDADDILTILREHHIVTDATEETTRQGLQQGHVLISQISEYSAIYLAHKLRRFDLDLKIGLSDQLHPSKSYESQQRGLVSKDSLRQNKQENVNLADKTVSVENIIVVTTQSIHQYDIVRYMELVTSARTVPESELRGAETEQSQTLSYSLDLGSHYQELATDLKNKAQKIGANALVGVQYQLTPLIRGEDQEQVYTLTSSGSAVWATKKG